MTDRRTYTESEVIDLVEVGYKIAVDSMEASSLRERGMYRYAGSAEGDVEKNIARLRKEIPSIGTSKFGDFLSRLENFETDTNHAPS